MRITDIAYTKKGRISVFVDDEFTCSIHPDVWVPAGLSIGSEVTSHQMEALYRQSQERITRERALRLLSQRAYTRKGLRDKLAIYVDGESADAAVARMEELGLIDDEDYARRYAADCISLKGYSPRRTERALREKGIDRETAARVAEELDMDVEASIAAIIQRKYMRYLGDEKGVQKTLNALVRLGYDFGDVRRVMANLREDPDYYQETVAEE